MYKTFAILTVPVLASLMSPGTASAQAGAVRADAARGASAQPGVAPEMLAPAPGESAPALPGDAEYGEQKVIARRSNWEPWQLGVLTGISYATNPALVSGDGSKDDWYFNAGLYAGYTPHVAGNWFLDTGLSQTFYDYDSLDLLDFARTYTYAGVLHSTPADAPAFFRNTVTSLRYRLEYLTSVDDLSEDFFTDHAIQLAFQRTFRISRGHRAYAGLTGSWSVDSSVEVAARDEYAAVAGYRIEWTPEFSTRADVRTALYDYRDGDHLDWNNTLGVAAEYKLTDWAAITANFGWVFNRSDDSTFDYDNGDMGGALNLHVNF